MKYPNTCYMGATVRLLQGNLAIAETAGKATEQTLPAPRVRGASCNRLPFYVQ